MLSVWWPGVCRRVAGESALPRLAAVTRHPDATDRRTEGGDGMERIRQQASTSLLELVEPGKDGDVQKRVDDFAGKMARMARLAAWTPYLLGALAVWAASLEVFTEWGGWNVVELVLLILALMLVGWARWRGWHEIWVQSRMFAEMLRIQTAIKKVNPDLSLLAMDSLDSVIGAYGNEAWVRAFRRACCGEQTDRAGENGMKRYLLDLVESQHAYHEKRKERMENRNRLLGALTLTLFILSGLASLAHLLHWLGEKGAPAWLFCAIALPALAGALHAINKREDPEQLAEISRAMLAQLDELSAKIEEAGEDELAGLAERVATLLASEALGWRASVGVQEVEVPT